MPLRRQFYTYDLDEAVEHYLRAGLEHSRTMLDRSGFGWGYRSEHGDNTMSGLVTSQGRQQLRGGEDLQTALLHVSLDHRANYRIGSKELSSAPGRAVFIPPGHIYSRVSPSGKFLSVVIRPEQIAAVLEEHWAGRRGHFALAAMELVLDEALSAALLNQAWCLDDVGSSSTPPVGIHQREHHFLTMLADAIGRQQGLTALSPRRALRVAQLERWIDDHLQNDLSVNDLAAVAGVKPNTLGKSTIAARGLSPKELLVARRMTAAHRALRTGEARSVSEAAHSCGFTHLGRFAVAYKTMIGESPSDTLRRQK